MRREKIKFLHKMEITAIRKGFKQNRKAENINSAHQSRNFRRFDIKHLRWSKTDLSKETKNDSKMRLRISLAVVQRCTAKKVSLKISPPAYLHISKIDIK